MEDIAAAAAAANGLPPVMTAVPPSQKRGQKRGRDAQEHAVAVASGGGVDDTGALWFMQQVDDDDEVRFANQMIDFLGSHLMNADDAKAGSDQDLPSADDDDLFAAACLGDDDASAELPRGGAPSNNNSSSGAPFDFDLNHQLLSPEDEGFLVAPCNANAVISGDGSAAATVGDGGDGSVEFAADDDATTVRLSSGGLGFDLNEPCPSELLFSDGAPPDHSDMPEPSPPAPAEGSLAEPNADDPPKLPDGGAPVSRTRRRHLRLWDWAFEWANGLGLGPLGWKRSLRVLEWISSST